MAEAIFWTRQRIERLLLASDSAVERAIRVLYERQVQGAVAEHAVNLVSARGFCDEDTLVGGHYARWVLDGRTLTGLHLDAARQIALRHTAQLADEALRLDDKRASSGKVRVAVTA